MAAAPSPPPTASIDLASPSYSDFATPPAYKDFTPDKPFSPAASLAGGALPSASAFLASLSAAAPPSPPPPPPLPLPPMLLDLIARQARAHPAKALFTFHEDGAAASRVITYEQLEVRTRALATELLCRGAGSGGSGAPLLRRGDRAMLVFLPSLDFILAFLACLRAGVTPVPCYPPDPRNLRVNVSLFASVCASCGAKVALTHGAYSSLVSLASMKDSALRWLGLGGSGSSATQWPELAWWDVEEATSAGLKRGGGSGGGGAAAAAAALDAAAPSDLAFLQYTSGSTSEPKGVRITHANISHNLATIVASLRAGPDTVVASWLPQYHDMGLIGSYLGVLACGGSGYYMSPLSFLKSPMAWLHMVSRVRATHIQAPNFAYSLLARRWREAAPAERQRLAPTLDLSSLRHAFNAAETVTAAALADFCAAFAPLGFSPAAFAPGYGLAENTVYVCDGGSQVVYLDREVLEASGRAEVLASCAITSLHTGGGAAALAAATLCAAPGCRIGSYVSCGPVCTPPGLAPAPPATPTPSSATPAPPGAKNPDVWVLVVAPATCMPCMVEGTVGEIWVCSPSKADGYEGKPDASRAAFGARLVIPSSSSSSSSSSSNALAQAQQRTATTSPLAAAAAAAAAAAVAGSEDTQALAAAVTPTTARTTAAAGTLLYPFSSPRPAAAEEVPDSPGSPVGATAAAAAAAAAPPSLAEVLPAGTSWLRTGDMGFIWRGELFLCSRIKDLIITRGRNLYPQDIEAAVEAGVGAEAAAGEAAVAPAPAAAPAPSLLRPGATAVFTVPSSEFKDAAASEGASEDALVVVAEVRDGMGASLLGQAVSSIRNICARDFGVRPHAVLLLKARGTRKTTSGKVARSHNATAYTARLRGGGVGERNPWGEGNAVVLMDWRSDGAAAAAEAGEGSSSSASSQAAAASAPSLALRKPSSSSSGAEAPGSAAPVGSFLALVGPALEAQLKRDVAGMMGESAWESLPMTESLLDLGLDSLALAQLPPRINFEYGFHVGDPQVFSPAFTLAWLVSNAEALRAGPVELPVVAAAAAAAAAAAPQGGAPAGSGGATAGAVTAAAAAAAAAATPGGAPPTPSRRPRAVVVQPSAFETNCPCFLLCYK